MNISTPIISRVWQPSTRPNETEVPLPGQETARTQQQQVYTKTSLSHQNDENDSTIKTLNRQIRAASSAYNSTPKPFVRQHAFRSSGGGGGGSQLASTPIRFTDAPRPFGTATSNHQSDADCSNNSSNMAPKLVHSQYNSPLELYSMNNIRKTIEAHSELLAPGVKGINFMKTDAAPINKQSEVYKLVKEQEEELQRAQQQPPAPAPQQQAPYARTSPISGLQASLSGGWLPTTSGSFRVNQPASSHQSSIMRCPKHSATTESLGAAAANPIGRELGYTAANESKIEVAATTYNKQNLTPRCSECGQLISGPFAKVQKRFVHPHCFNCTTCGTSLKNCGYFTINDKLYCDIHAKQVAKVMQINHNFGQQPSDGSPSGVADLHAHSHYQQHNPAATAAAVVQQHSPVSVQVSPGGGWRACDERPLLKQNTTISTMFDTRERQQNLRASQAKTVDEATRWNWQQAAQPVETLQVPQQFNMRKQMVASSDSFACKTCTQKQQQIDEVDAKEYANSSRVPICSNCSAKIQGPYILAGQTTWCKPCSQSQFACSSCSCSLLNVGFVEAPKAAGGKSLYCEICFENYYAPICAKCQTRVKGDCLNALGKHWHPNCFVCGYCRQPFGNSSFYLEDRVPYCERDWNLLFTTKCYSCKLPIEASNRWIEALGQSYHTSCFRCTSCNVELEGSTFYCRAGRPYCASHAR